MAEKRKVLHYRVSIQGVWGRKRKKDFATFLLLKDVDPATPKTTEELMPIFRAKLAAIGAKPGSHVRLYECPIETDGVFETYVLYSDRELHREVLG